MGSFRTNSEVHPEAKDTHIARRGTRHGRHAERVPTENHKRRRSIHQARSSTLEVRGAGRAPEKTKTPQRGPYQYIAERTSGNRLLCMNARNMRLGVNQGPVPGRGVAVCELAPPFLDCLDRFCLAVKTGVADTGEPKIPCSKIFGLSERR